VNIEEWVAVYQGNFPEDQWNKYQLPVADDWMDYFGYLPEITSLVYINDKDNGNQGAVYFDYVVDITEDLPVAPEVSINYNPGANKGKGFEVQFYSEVIDPDSDEHDYFWNFGDGTTSTEENPVHTFAVSDDHPYTVFLRVVDATNYRGYASCKIEVEQGSSTFPVSINFVGDMMLARAYEQWGGIIPTLGVEAIFEPTKQYLGDAADFTVGNLECPLTTYYSHHPTKTIYFKGSPDNVDGLSYAGIDMVTLANNHILDYMQPGLMETQSVLEENDILHIGAGTNSHEAYLPAFYSKSGVNIAFLGASDRTGQYNNYQPYLDAGHNKAGFANLTDHYIKKQIDEVREVSDLVVIQWHSGGEYSFEPIKNEDALIPFSVNGKTTNEYQPRAIAPDKGSREIRQFAIDNGANLVICHHPHIIHGVELYKGKLIAHSLGDYVFDLDYPETFPSMILDTKVNETGFYEFTITPLYIDDYIPQRAWGGLGLHILDWLAQRSKELDTWLDVDRENITATVVMDTLNIPSYEAETMLTLALEEANGIWETAPHPIRKTGNISSIAAVEPPGDYEFRMGRDEIWWGTMEDEGCTLWDLNNVNESYCDTMAIAGMRSLQHFRNENSPFNLVTNFEQRILCPSDTINYSLCGYIKTMNGAGVTIEVNYYQDFELGVPIGTENIGVEINGDTPWTFYHKQLTVPPGTGYFDIRLNSNVPQSGEAYSWFDNVSLISWDEWGEYDVTDAIPTPNDYYFIQLRASQNMDKIVVYYTETVLDGLYVGLEEPTSEIISIDILKQNFPNPFNPEIGPTDISFELDYPGRIKIEIFDVRGQMVKVITDERFSSGTQHLSWDGRGLNGQVLESGIYFYQLTSENSNYIRKCMLFRN
jgi:poly-gamma-glutamate capsule biosynthesis protein CapA/YwtB (metallophosphatase superfamily)